MDKIKMFTDEELRLEYEKTENTIEILKHSLNETSPANAEEYLDLKEDLQGEEDYLDKLFDEKAERKLE